MKPFPLTLAVSFWLACFLAANLIHPVSGHGQNNDPFGLHITRQQAELIDAEGLPIGTAEYWNTRTNFMVELSLAEDWRIKDAQVYL
ncbi:MAG: hypothetical protein D3910_24440, partial [Candidatus Electrothrix sp. ATG2]|nr:hypothetical protein [Candidatus Electrothrix sp. ATG2]